MDGFPLLLALLRHLAAKWHSQPLRPLLPTWLSPLLLQEEVKAELLSLLRVLKQRLDSKKELHWNQQNPLLVPRRAPP